MLPLGMSTAKGHDGHLLRGIRPRGVGQGFLQQPLVLQPVPQHLLDTFTVAVRQLLRRPPNLHIRTDINLCLLVLRSNARTLSQTSNLTSLLHFSILKAGPDYTCAHRLLLH